MQVARTKKVDRMFDIGSELDVVCENCHLEYRFTQPGHAFDGTEVADLDREIPTLEYM